MKIHTLLIVLGSFVAFGAAHLVIAQDQSPVPTLEQELKDTEAGFRKVDAEMNEIYQGLLAKLRPQEQDELRNAQRTWLKDRNHFAATEESTTESHVTDLIAHGAPVPDAHAADDLLVFRFLRDRTSDRLDILKKYVPAQGNYPPTGYNKIQEVESPTKDFILQEFDKPQPDGTAPGEKQVWIVSSTDPSDHHALPFYRGETGENRNESYEKASYKISPDDKWIFREQRDEFGLDSAYLYGRKTGTEFEKQTGKPLDDLAWEFFARTVKKLGRDSLRHYSVAFGSWRDNSKKVRLLLSGDEKHAWIIENWTCDYNLETGKFELPAELRKQNSKAIVDTSKD
jgi:uncharacterized protein YecT (DUF1311 family)